MGKERTKKHSSAVTIRNLINLGLIIAGLVAVVSFMTKMQHDYSVAKSNQSATAALDTVIDTLTSNSEKIETLRSRYHSDNRAVLNDISALMKSEHYASLTTATTEERCAVMEQLSRAVGDSGYLFVIDGDGNILLSPEEAAIGSNIVSNGSLRRDDLNLLTSSSEVDYSKAPVTGTPAGTNVTAYFYGCPISGNYYLVYAVDSLELDKQFEALKDIKPVLTSVVVGNDGFVFAVDSETGLFMCFDDGTTCLDGKSYGDAGLSADALTDRYSGLQTINGVSYQCLSRKYSSPIYGEYTVITAVCPSETIFSSDKATINLTAATFVICAGVILLYAMLLQQDPEQMAHYDEHVFSGKEAYHERRKKPLNTIHNIRAFKLKGKNVYLKFGIAEKLAPVVAIASLLVFAISWNSQTLTEISNGMALSADTVEQMETMFNNRVNSSEIIMNRYQSQYLAKLKLISFLMEEAPGELEKLNDATSSGQVYTHVGTDMKPVTDEYGNPVRSLANSDVLDSLAKNNGFDFLAVFDDQGRTIAVNTDLWYFVINRTEGTQSHPFLDVISGHKDSLIQDAGIDESGRNMQYIGTVYHYYMLSGEGKDNGRYVSAADYQSYLDNGSFVCDGVSYKVDMHRGMIQGGISDSTILAIMESTSNNALMSQIRVGADGFTILFDNSSDHVCLWSPYESSIGRTAAELNIPDASFSGTFKGFTRINGIKYFQTYTYEDGYWLATTIPADTMLAGRNPISIITLIVSTVFFLLIFLLCIFSTEEEEDLLEASLEKRVGRSNDNGMVKVMMPSGKMKYVRSASARYTGGSVLWDDMTTDQKLSRVLKIALSVVVICILLSVIFCDSIFGTGSSISYIVHGDWERGMNYFALVAFATVILSVSVLSFVISSFINFIIRNMGARIETVGQLLLSVVKYGAVLFSIFYGLSLLGFSTAGIVTSASIMSIVIGLGAQSLISDILSGIFIVFEGAFRVGDIVTVGDFRGSVVDIGLRTTKIESTAGDIKIFNNSSIAGIINMTKKASKAVCDIGIEYSADLKQVEALLNKELQRIGDANDMIIGIPKYIGVVELGESAVVLRVVAECSEKDRMGVSRYLNRELFLLFTENNIGIPFPQVTLSYLHPDDEPEDKE